MVVRQSAGGGETGKGKEVVLRDGGAVRPACQPLVSTRSASRGTPVPSAEACLGVCVSGPAHKRKTKEGKDITVGVLLHFSLEDREALAA